LRFHRTPALLTWIFPSLVWRIDTSSKEIYLTFDDGPVPGPTEFVLDVLGKNGIKATFFCIGRNIEKHPHIFERVRAEGHSIANHTFDHVNGWKTPTNDYVRNIAACHSLLQDSQFLFRPPYGKITPSEVQRLRHYKIIMWDVLTYDFDATLLPDQCLKGAIDSTRPGSIIVFHDSYKAEKNMQYALPRFIADCRTRGYQFKTLGTTY
jgi:peptidoglycan/xylan/chitin deacetylase (PgdA/CDA1 family)